MADLQISKQSSTNAVTAGQLYTYTIIINNAGPGPAQGVTVKILADGAKLQWFALDPCTKRHARRLAKQQRLDRHRDDA